MPGLSKIAILGIVVLSTGMLFAVIEKVFYGNRLDANNVLQESLFLPLSILFILAGAGIIVFAALRFAWLRIKHLLE